jgi:hypothetical protein
MSKREEWVVIIVSISIALGATVFGVYTKVKEMQDRKAVIRFMELKTLNYPDKW